MSYFKVIPELKEELNLDRCEWLLLCLIISYPKVTMSNQKMANVLSYGRSQICEALKKLVDRGLVNLIPAGGGNNIKVAANREQYDYYLGNTI